MKTIFLPRFGTAFLCFLFAWIPSSSLWAQCQYLAYDGFNYPNASPLNGLFGGTGWERPWEVQVENTTVPGYQGSGAASLGYETLRSLGNHGAGGHLYLTAGRRLDTSTSGPFAAYLASGAIGATGTTLWYSGLLQKDQNNDQTISTHLHSDNITWYVHNPRVGFGYFGTNSNDGGVRYWTLQLNDTFYRTSIPVTLGQPAFFVLAITFDAANGHTIRLFVNPSASDLGASTAPAPTMTQTLAGSLPIRAIGLYLGSNAQNGRVDELRMANSWQCATPTTSTPVNEPPTAAFTASNTDGISPLTIGFDASNSSDPDGPISEYRWSFGDGSPEETGQQVSHTFTPWGVLQVSLTVTDHTGLKHRAYQNITLRNAQNTFSCLSAVSMNQRPTCGQSNGSFSVVLASGVTATLRNAANETLAGTNGTYSNLATGTYTLSTLGTNGCTDQFTLYMTEDPTTCAGWTANPCDMNVGVNLSGPAYWTQERALKDYMKRSGRWVTFTATGPSPWETNTHREMPTDDDGYPTVIPYPSSLGPQAVRGVISANGHMQPSLDYVLLYDGEGSLQMAGGIENVAYQAGRITFRVRAGYRDNIWFHITASTQGNHVRNIRILKTSDETTYLSQPFDLNFIERLRPFKAIRFLDWNGANDARPLNTWADRTRPTRYSQAADAPSGVAFEYIVQLANMLDKDIWLTVPHLASDAFLQDMAAYFRDQLEPERTIYLEYSNEVWNWMFSQAHWVNNNGPNNLNYARKYAERAVHLFDIWMSVFGAQNHRLKRIFNVQSVNPWYGREVLSHTPPSKYDYLSPSWYFGYADPCEQTLDALGAGATARDVLTCVRQVYNNSLAAVRQNYLNASLFGKEVVNYEGGQHITTIGAARSFQAATYASQIHPDIYTLYTDVMTDLRRMGSRLAMAFTLAGARESVYGSWGHIEDSDQAGPYLTVAPKYQALLDQINQCSTNALPITLAGFSGRVLAENAIELYWQTTSEVNEEGFYIEQGEKDPAGKTMWKTIGYVKAQGFSTDLQTYRFTHSNLRYGKHQFRLRSVSFDGQSSLSSVIEVKIELPAHKPLVLNPPFPNPFNRHSTLSFAAPNGIATRLEVYDLLGRRIAPLKIGFGTGEEETFVWQPQGLAAGIYFLRLTDETGRQQLQRLVKVD